MGEVITAASLSSTVRAMERLIRSHINVIENSSKVVDNNNIDQMKKNLSMISSNNVVSIPGSRRKTSTVKDLTKKDEKVTVYVKILFLKIGVIDTIHDRYTAEVMVQTKWREPALDSLKESAREIDLSTYWNPKVTISNGIGDLKYTTTVFVEYDHVDRAWVFERRRTNGQFFEFMELNKFPFDGQDLTITVTSERVDSELEFVQDENSESAVNPDAFSAAQEWKLHEKVNIWTKYNVKKVNKKKMKYPCFCVAAKVARRPQFFIYNIIVIMFSICSLAFATFTVKLETPESRLPLTFFLVLTTVTFKFVVNKSLPKISYLTYLDKYILGSMVILCIVCIWHSMVGSFINSWTQGVSTVKSTIAHTNSTVCPNITKPGATATGKMIDQIALGVFAAIYIGFHLCFLFSIVANKEDDGVNENLNINDDDDDEKEAEKKENRNNMAMVALGLFGNGDKVSPANQPNTKTSPQPAKQPGLPTVVE